MREEVALEDKLITIFDFLLAKEAIEELRFAIVECGNWRLANETIGALRFSDEKTVYLVPGASYLIGSFDFI